LGELTVDVVADGADATGLVRKGPRDRWREMAPAWLDVGGSSHAATTGAAAMDGMSAARERSIERVVSPALAWNDPKSKHSMRTFGNERMPRHALAGTRPQSCICRSRRVSRPRLSRRCRLAP